MKYCAFILLRVNEKLEQGNRYYQQCLKQVSGLFEISLEKLELLVDAVAGNPIDIFKVKNRKFISYNV